MVINRLHEQQVNYVNYTAMSHHNSSAPIFTEIFIFQ